MSREALVAEKRDASGKSPTARRLRNSGMTPGVLYSNDGDNVPFAADELAVAAIIRHGAQLVDLDLDGSKHISLLKDYQVHPVRGSLVHLDLQEVRMDETLKMSAPIHVVGEAPGIKIGGVLTQNVHELQIECKASSIPDHIDVDVSDLQGGDSLHLAKVAAPEGVTFLDPPETLLMTISMPRGARGAAKAAAEGGEGAEAAAEG
jgi:large subunit ribosomal protein L25